MGGRGRGGAAPSRGWRIDREPVPSATAFGDHLRMVWLTPSMDGLFLGAASERRRFFDRLVLAIDSPHSSRVSALDRSLRSRNRLLAVRHYDDPWCDARERQTAGLALAGAGHSRHARTKTPDRGRAWLVVVPKLGPQVWMTGADPLAFPDIGAKGEISGVDSGQTSRRA